MPPDQKLNISDEMLLRNPHTLKRIFLSLVFILLMTSLASAFLYEVKILSKEELKKLTGDQLVDLYTSALIEREASETFHGKAGFTPKEYEAFKELLGLIVRIRQEMLSRELEPPPIDQWLKK